MLRAAFLALLLSSAFSAAAAMTRTCESMGSYTECRVGAGGTIRLVSEISNRRCFEGLSWGTRSGGIVWVDKGCRGRFATDEPASPHDRIVCESHDGTRQVCAAKTENGVTLYRQLSKTECLEGQNWDYEPRRDVLWVDQGCRAEFVLGKFRDLAPQRAVLDHAVTCESENGRRKDCPADTSLGVQIVRQLSDTPCRYARDWGYDTKSIWVNKGCRAEFVVRPKPKPMLRSLTCESQNGTRSHCPAETTYGVALVRQLSEQACELDRSWGFDAEGVWVAEGCRAQFALGGFRLASEAVPPTAARVTCASADGKRVQCAAGAHRGVGLIHQLGDAACVLNRTWGYDAEAIWVTEGCRAEFAVAR